MINQIKGVTIINTRPDTLLLSISKSNWSNNRINTVSVECFLFFFRNQTIIHVAGYSCKGACKVSFTYASQRSWIESERTILDDNFVYHFLSLGS